MSGIDPRLPPQDLYAGPSRPAPGAPASEGPEPDASEAGMSFVDKLDRLRRMATGDLTRETDLRGPAPPRHIQWGLQYSAPSQLILMHQLRQQQADETPPPFRGHL